MKLKKLTPFFIVLEIQNTPQLADNSDTSQFIYILGGLIALFILGYLIYSLLRPEKF
jgi:K+-transporting ATPase KdpF subunit